MLDELKNLKTPGNRDGFLFFLKSVIGDRQLTYEDICMLCSHAPGVCQISLPEMVQYCFAFGLIRKTENVITITPKALNIQQNMNALIDELIRQIIISLFESEVFCINMFLFDIASKRILFRNELFPLAYSAIRNTLINLGFFDVERSLYGTNFFVTVAYENFFSKLCKTEKKKMTLSQLRKKLDADAEIGEEAEIFSMIFEKRRIESSISEMIKIISDIDVAAGYDIISFESNASTDYDRFIEVKAVSHDMGFFWSRNEYEIAKLKGDHYYLYLVEVGKIAEADYTPVIIQNPAETIMESPEWMVQTQSYHVQHI